jgi:hypothetical protein
VKDSVEFTLERRKLNFDNPSYEKKLPINRNLKVKKTIYYPACSSENLKLFFKETQERKKKLEYHRERLHLIVGWN